MKKKTKYSDVINKITSQEVGGIIVAQAIEKKRDEAWLQDVEKEKEAGSGEQKAPDNITFTITMDKEGKVGISGPLFDKILCYGLLEYAKGLVANWRPKQGAPKPKTKGAFGK